MHLVGDRTQSRVSIPSIAFLIFALTLASVGFEEQARAESGSNDMDVKAQLKEVWEREKFSGDWEGLRTKLQDRGIDIGLRLSQYGQGVASGGVDPNGEYGGRMDYRVNADLRKLFGLWEGFSFSMHAMPWFGSVRGLSMWGGGGWTIKNEMIQGGFLVTGTENVTTTWDFAPSFEEGVFMAGFYRFFWELGDLPGNSLIFAGGSTRDQASNDPLDFIDVPGQVL